ncbi:MAG: GGDEF domain-containing protein [Clostridia bacterium]
MSCLPKKLLMNVQKSRAFFQGEARHITETNLYMLRSLSLQSSALLLLLSVAITIWFHSPVLTLAYASVLLVQMGLCGISNFCFSKLLRHPQWLHGLIILYLLSLLIFVTVISIVPYLDRPGVFFSLIVLTLQLVFLLPFWEQTVITLVSTMIFLVFSYFYKSGIAFSYDLFTAGMGWVLGLMLHRAMFLLRVREHELNQELLRVSTTDALTGLANKETTERQITQSLNAMQSHQSCALVLVVPEGLKQIADIDGREQSDYLLCKMGDIFTGLAGKADIVGRTDDDEFMLLMDGVSNDAQAERRILAIGNAVEELTSLDGQCALLCAIGVALYPRDGECFAALYRKADQALRQQEGTVE